MQAIQKLIYETICRGLRVRPPDKTVASYRVILSLEAPNYCL